MKNILVAGATGYLGKYIVKELDDKKFNTIALARNPSKLQNLEIQFNRLVQADVTDKSTLVDCCKGVDVVISALGITKQADGLSYMEVDYQANVNLLDEAKSNGVKKFIYISVLNGEKLQSLNICAAKEKFVRELKISGLEYCVIRPNGFFSDMTEFYKMAEKGRIYLFGDGKLKSNPIHGYDLAQLCVSAIDSNESEIEVGGPETLSQNEIATFAFEAAGKPVKITYIPDWIRRLMLRVLKRVLSANRFGPIEFFMNVMAIEMVAPEYGVKRLQDYFKNLKHQKCL